jgi:hypothetical protein
MTHQQLHTDRSLSLRVQELEQKEEELSASERTELDELYKNRADFIQWEKFCMRAERCIANWCIANPEIVDLQGRPAEERGGVKNVDHVFNPPPPPPKCALCNGRGFINLPDGRGAEFCTCQGVRPGRSG